MPTHGVSPVQGEMAPIRPPAIAPTAAVSAVASSPPPALPRADVAVPAPSRKLAFPPAKIAPLYPSTASANDGEWEPVDAANMPGREDGKAPILFATTLHPNLVKRTPEVAIIAIDHAALELDLVVGTLEPASKEFPKSKRNGLVANGHLASLVFVTNGGFMAKHGQHGMAIGDDVILPLKADSCSFAKLEDGSLFIGSSSDLGTKKALFVRQAPPCLLHKGERHPDLEDPVARKKWGAAADGGKAIRRSAFALGPDGALYFAVGESVTAAELADSLARAGATEAIEMDVNYSFTRFVVYGRDAKGNPVGRIPVLSKLVFGPKDYWKNPAPRDFFYGHLRATKAP